MFDSALGVSLTEMQVVDLRSDIEFTYRKLRPREPAVEAAGMQRLAHVFTQCAERISEELVQLSMDLCDADSAGISLEERSSSNELQFRWIAAAGRYGGFLGAVLPRFYSPCGTCLDRGQPQLFRVPKPYLDMIGVEAPEVTDGILIPWQIDETRGTLWILAHGSYQRFDREDYRIMQSLSDFAAIAVRYQQQQAKSLQQAAFTARTTMANQLAHQINNPLQGLMQTVYLAGQGGPEAAVFTHQAIDDLVKLAEVVKQCLSLPKTM